jgi:hypothetical protein
MKYCLSFLVLFVTFNTAALNNLQTKVVMVQMVFRSGIRTPEMGYPTSQVPLNYWERYGGSGQLTPIGMKQMNKFGANFRNFYPFLNKTYQRKRVVVKSSDKDRTLQSCYVFLTGLFAPSNEQRWTKTSNLSGYMPIPVHLDNDIFHSDKRCDRYEYLRTDARNSNEWLKIENSYKV